MLLLGIESSCDETAAAVVRDGRDVLCNVIASQDELHVEYGGVVPEIASRAHVERMLPVLRRALADAGVGLGEIDAVAVGSRPGLIGSLVVGVAAAKALSWSLGRPLVGVDHVHAHLYAGLLEREAPAFPALGLVVSGGHTSLYTCDSILDIRRIGSTIDDAVGEAYDKVATILGLEFPGGPKLDRLAQQGDEQVHEFPVSRIAPDSLDLSFSGLKTAVLYAVRGVPQRWRSSPSRDAQGASGQERHGSERRATRFERDHHDLSEQQKADVAASFQRAAVRAVMLKLERTFERHPCRTLLIGGGVSANSRLRRELTEFADQRGLDLRLPKMPYCLDNAAMIAGLGHALLLAGRVDDQSLRAMPSSVQEMRQSG
ncbi:MAG: tRNA (adenosine(37)-N6)-threonylcarbamoyltransferase complex transferase subunit TsaD [Phycisphaeraceae bacterium]|nr:MAG: tRNA (adenosine(37)-N6)-threonylcarbamoyltransferase complex transferase subunit TsaD [Phycisphaeraceae bacterium]